MKILNNQTFVTPKTVDDLVTKLKEDVKVTGTPSQNNKESAHREATNMTFPETVDTCVYC